MDDQCCSPCSPQLPPVNVVGPVGAAGANGTNGINAFSTLTAALTVPGDTVTPVTALVSSSTWMVVGQVLIIGQGAGSVLVNPGPATFKITAIPSASSVTMLWLNQQGDVVAGSSIDIGAVVSAAGRQGVFPTTTKGDLIVDNGGASPNPSPTRFPVGNNGRGVVADSTQTLGVKYAGLSQTLNVNTTPVGNGNDTTEDNLMSYIIPANTLLNNGDSIEFECVFQLAANAHTKQVKVYFGATAIITFPATAINGGQMIISGRIVRTGANTQIAYAVSNQTDGAASSTNLTGYAAPAENLAGGVTIKATGKTGTANASDISQVSMVVDYRAQ